VADDLFSGYPGADKRAEQEEDRLREFAIMPPEPPEADDPEPIVKEIEQATKPDLFGGMPGADARAADPVEGNTATLYRKEPPKPNALQVLYLQQNPETADAFDQKFGYGAAARALGQNTKPPTEKQAEALVPPPVGIPSIGGDEAGKGDLPPHLQGYIARQDMEQAARTQEAASKSLEQAYRNNALEGWDHEKEVQEAEALREAWALKAAQAELMGQDRQIALRGLKAAEARLGVARQLLQEKNDNRAQTVGTAKARMMMATVMAYQGDRVAAAEARLEAAQAAANSDNEDLQGVLELRNAENALQEQRAVMHYLEQKAQELGDTAAVEDPSSAGELVRGLVRGAFGQIPTLLGHAMEWASRNSEMIDLETGEIYKGADTKALGAAGNALKSWGRYVEKTVPKPAFEGGMFDIEDVNGFKMWLAKSFGEAVGTSAGIMLPAALFGAPAGVVMGIGIGQGGMKQEIEEAFAARGRTLDPIELNKYVTVYGTAIGLLDAAGGLMVLRTLSKPMAAKVRATLAGTIAKKAIEGKLEEGVTEGMQEVLQIIGVDQAVKGGIDPSLMPEYAKRVIEAAVAGGLVGGTYGAIGGLRAGISDRERAEKLKKLQENVLKDIVEEQQKADPEQATTPETPPPPGQRPVVEGQPVIQPETPVTLPPPTPRPPGDLTSIIRDVGGIQDPTGDLEAMGVPPRFINPNGVPLDTFREMLVEDGFLTESLGGEATTTLDDVYELMQRVADGQRVVRIQDELDAQAADAARGEADIQAQENAAILRELEGQMQDDGVPYDLTDMEEARVVQYVRDEGLDPFDAFERVTLERYSETGGRGRIRPGQQGAGRYDAESDIPFAFTGTGGGRPTTAGMVSGAGTNPVLVDQSPNTITPGNVSGLGDYLKGGGSLARRAFPDIASAAGVAPEEVADLLEAAEQQGIIKRDSRGRWRRQPGYQAELDRIENPTDMAALNAAQNMMTARLRAGRNIVVSDSLQTQTMDAIRPTLHMVPADTDVGVLSEVIPIGMTTFDGRPDIDVDLRFTKPDGKSFIVELPWSQVVTARALFIPPEYSGAGRPAILHLRLMRDGISEQLISGGQYHEIVHSLRRSGGFTGPVWDRLTNHAMDLGSFDMEFGEYLRLIGSPAAADALPGDYLIDAYIERYEGRDDIKALLLEEAVAHMIELYAHGHYSTDQMAPVQDIIDQFESGALTGRAQGDGAAAMAALRGIHYTRAAPFDRFKAMPLADFGFWGRGIYMFPREYGEEFGRRSISQGGRGLSYGYVEDGSRNIPVEVDSKKPFVIDTTEIGQSKGAYEELKQYGYPFDGAPLDVHSRMTSGTPKQAVAFEEYVNKTVDVSKEKLEATKRKNEHAYALRRYNDLTDSIAEKYGIDYGFRVQDQIDDGVGPFKKEEVEAIQSAAKAESEARAAMNLASKQASVSAKVSEMFTDALLKAGYDSVVLEKNGRPYEMVAIKPGTVKGTYTDQPMFALAGRPLPDGQQRVPRSGLNAPERGLSELIEDLATALNIELPRSGRLSPGLKAQAKGRLRGQHNMATGVTRLAMTNDIETFSHEAGHALEARFGKQGLRQIMERHRTELEPLASPGKDALSEGFSEFVRRYITNPAAAQNAAPQFMDEFEDFIDIQEPILLDVLDGVVTGYQEWIESSSAGVVKTHVRTAKKPGVFGKFFERVRKDGLKGAAGTYADEVYTAVLDDLHPVKVATQRLLEIAKQNINVDLGKREQIAVPAASDPYKLLRLARNSYQSGHIDLMSGVRPYQGTEHMGPSFREAVSTAMGGEGKGNWTDERLADFNAYLVARRMVQEWTRFQNGELATIPDALSKGDHIQAIKDFEAEYPQFIDAADQIYTYQANLLKKAYDAGYIPEDVYNDLSGRQDYVPVHRHMDDPDGGATPGQPGKKNKTPVIKRFKGSTRDIIDPLETIARYTYELNFAIARNDAIKALDALSRAAGPGGGMITERIPAKELRGQSVGVMEVIENAAKQQGIDPADMVFMRQAIEETLGEDASATIFRAGDINEKGEPIIYLWEKGKRIPLRLADGEFGKDMYEAITGLGQEWSGIIINTLALPSQWLRAGVTLDPAFAMANYFRDQMSAWILTEDHGGLLPNAAGAAVGTVSAGQDLFGGTTSDLDLANSMGLIMGGEGVAGLHEARVKRDVKRLSRKGIKVREFHPMRPEFWKATGLTETGTRISVFRRARQRALNDGLNEYEAAVEAAYSANDMIDFGRHGSKMLVARRLVTFLNAALQGLDRSARTARGKTENVRTVRDLISPYIKSRNGQPLTIAERRRVSLATKMWGRIAMISLIGAALTMLYLDDEDYEEFPEYFRDTHWLFKLGGQWFRIPKPFELGAGSLILERGIEAFVKGDEAARDRLLRGLVNLATPPTSIPGMTLALELTTNKQFGIGETVTTAMLKQLTGQKVDSRDLVPQNMLKLPAEMQYTAQTSEISRMLAQWTGYSAIKWDHIIQGLGGSLGRTALDLSKQLPSDRPRTEMRPEEMIFLRRFTAEPARSSQSKRQFWQLMSRYTGEFEGASSALKKLYDEGRENSPEADALLESMNDNERAFALLELYEDKISVRRMHPLNRAMDIISVSNGIRKELLTGELKKADGSAYSPREMRQIQETIELIQLREARNALIAIGHPGWSHMRVLDGEAPHRELEALVPDLAEEYNFRLGKKKLPSFEEVREGWPDLKREILDPDYRLINEPKRKRGRQSSAIMGETNLAALGTGVELPEPPPQSTAAPEPPPEIVQPQPEPAPQRRVAQVSELPQYEQKAVEQGERQKKQGGSRRPGSIPTVA
jgi:hypothetical protein